jgi:putative resolvase
VRLSERAARNGVHYRTAWTWAKEGRMPVPVAQTPSGMWLVEESTPEVVGPTVAYCRVSSGDQKADLDRLARFGVEHLESALSASGRRLVVLDPQERASDLVRDVTGVLTSMCARLYGQRAAKNRAARAIAEATAPAAETTG